MENANISTPLINSKTTVLMNQIIYEYPLLDIEYPYMVINIMNYKRNSTPKQKPEPHLNDEKKQITAQGTDASHPHPK